jgi:hypothetical protein
VSALPLPGRLVTFPPTGCVGGRWQSCFGSGCVQHSQQGAKGASSPPPRAWGAKSKQPIPHPPATALLAPLGGAGRHCFTLSCVGPAVIHAGRLVGMHAQHRDCLYSTQQLDRCSYPCRWRACGLRHARLGGGSAPRRCPPAHHPAAGDWERVPARKDGVGGGRGGGGVGGASSEILPCRSERNSGTPHQHTHTQDSAPDRAHLGVSGTTGTITTAQRWLPMCAGRLGVVLALCRRRRTRRNWPCISFDGRWAVIPLCVCA